MQFTAKCISSRCRPTARLRPAVMATKKALRKSRTLRMARHRRTANARRKNQRVFSPASCWRRTRTNASISSVRISVRSGLSTARRPHSLRDRIGRSWRPRQSRRRGSCHRHRRRHGAAVRGFRLGIAKASVSMTISGPAPIIMAMYIAAANVGSAMTSSQLRGTIRPTFSRKSRRRTKSSFRSKRRCVSSAT